MDRVERRRARAENLLVSQRNYRRVRDRALARLANRYKAEYLELLEEEKANDVALNKKWWDISGATMPSMDIKSNNTLPSRTYTGENESEQE